jgi:hypothetical protein
MIRRIRVLLMHSLLRTPTANPVYVIENRSRKARHWAMAHALRPMLATPHGALVEDMWCGSEVNESGGAGMKS